MPVSKTISLDQFRNLRDAIANRKEDRWDCPACGNKNTLIIWERESNKKNVLYEGFVRCIMCKLLCESITYGKTKGFSTKGFYLFLVSGECIRNTFQDNETQGGKLFHQFKYQKLIY